MPVILIDLHPKADLKSFEGENDDIFCLMKNYQLFKVAYLGEIKQALCNPGCYPLCKFIEWHPDGYKVYVLVGRTDLDLTCSN